jgi:hypothetical protein
MGAFQAKFSPLADHESGKPVSAETPSAFTPRQAGQSALVSNTGLASTHKTTETIDIIRYSRRDVITFS